VVSVEREYRRIWAEWLADLKNLLSASGADDSARFIADHLPQAPVMQLNAKIDLGLTMRLASVRQTQGGASVTLSVGPIGASGQFGFMSKSTEESLMQVHAQYTMTNGEVSLHDYLTASQLELASAADIDKAVQFLES